MGLISTSLGDSCTDLAVNLDLARLEAIESTLLFVVALAIGDVEGFPLLDAEFARGLDECAARVAMQTAEQSSWRQTLIKAFEVSLPAQGDLVNLSAQETLRLRGELRSVDWDSVADATVVGAASMAGQAAVMKAAEQCDRPLVAGLPGTAAGSGVGAELHDAAARSTVGDTSATR